MSRRPIPPARDATTPRTRPNPAQVSDAAPNRGPAPDPDPESNPPPPPTPVPAAAVVVAAGLGTRFGVPDKCLIPLAGRPLLAHVLDALEASRRVDAVVVVVGMHTRAAVESLVAGGGFPKVAAVVAGGERRQDSVAAGIAALASRAAVATAEVVVVHDGARPLVTADLVDRCVVAAQAVGAAIAAVPVADTLKRATGIGSTVADDAPGNRPPAGPLVSGTVDRTDLWAAQTPQAFRRDVLARLVPNLTGPRTVTDEAALCEALGIPVALVPGSPANLKVTRPDDLAVAEALLVSRGVEESRSRGVDVAQRGDEDRGASGHRSPEMPDSAQHDEGSAQPGKGNAQRDLGECPPHLLLDSSTPRLLDSSPRTGIGYDAHRFAPGRRLVLGGVEIAHEAGLDGHSDADVLLHAVADALLGAAALGDIGHHFPPSDPRFKDADSRSLLREVGRLLASAGFRPVNVDATVIAESPRLAPYVTAMRAEIAACLGLPPEAVAAKATTNEGMGFVGRGEGIAALAVATVAPATG